MNFTKYVSSFSMRNNGNINRNTNIIYLNTQNHFKYMV